MNRLRILQVIALALSVGAPAVPAAAQDAPRVQPSDFPPGVTVDGGGHPYRRWDVAVSAGLHVDREVDLIRDPNTVFYDDDWRPGLGIQADVGRYWTSHLKTEAAFAYLTGHDVFGSDSVPVPEGIGEAYFRTDIARKYVGAAMTYQFLDNAFAHPYVSGGVRVSILDQHKVRDALARTFDRTGTRTYPIPPLDVRDRDVTARPYVAAGFKSYFDERTFIRSELSVAADDRGPAHWAVRLGFGVDF